MKIIDTGRTPDGIELVLEDWSKDYPTIQKKYCVAAFPIAKQSMEGYFMPQRGKTFRCAFEFEDLFEANKAFYKLDKGIITIYDLKEYLVRPEYEEIM